MLSNSITVKSLNPALGAEVKGVDFRLPLTPEVVSQIHNAWMEYQVLVFPSQPISDKQHVAVTRYFGTGSFSSEYYQVKICKRNI